MDPREQLQQAVGRALRRLLRTLERADSEPMAPEDLVLAVGQLAALERLNAGVVLPPDVIAPFFLPRDPGVPPALEDSPPILTGSELGAMLRDVLDGVATRLGLRGPVIPDDFGGGAEASAVARAPGA
jgi:hypothetical protein